MHIVSLCVTLAPWNGAQSCCGLASLKRPIGVDGHHQTANIMTSSNSTTSSRANWQVCSLYRSRCTTLLLRFKDTKGCGTSKLTWQTYVSSNEHNEDLISTQLVHMLMTYVSAFPMLHSITLGRTDDKGSGA